MRYTILAFVALAGLTGCEDITMGTTTGAPRAISNIDPRALAALPPGVPAEALIRDKAKCYGIVIEEPPRGEPAIGVPLRDAAGGQICDA